MKGKNKLIVPLLLAGMATTGVVSNVNTQQVALANTTQVVQPEITNVDGIQLGLIGGFQDTYDFGSPITMPKVTTGTLGTSGKVVYEIINGEKTIKTFTVTKADIEANADYNTTLTYTPTYTGRYIVKITASENGRVRSVINNLYQILSKFIM